MERGKYNSTSQHSVITSPEETVHSALKYRIDLTVYIMTVPLPPILAILGIVGNCLSFLLMKQKKYEKSTTCFYMRCLAVTDCLFIYGRMVLRYLLVMAPQVFTSPSVQPIYCRYYMVSQEIGLALSPWILVAMGFDRFIALTWPLKAAMLCTMRKAKITAAIIFSLGIGLGLVHLDSSWQEKYSFWLCPYQFDEPMGEIYVTFEGTITSVLPIILFSLLNCGILLAVCRSKHNPALNKSGSSSKESSITRATLLVMSTLVFFLLPDTIQDFFWANWHHVVTNDVKQWQGLSINIALLATSMNFCLNSYIYILTCKRLRQEWFSILKCGPKQN